MAGRRRADVGRPGPGRHAGLGSRHGRCAAAAFPNPRWRTSPLSTDELLPEARWLAGRYEFERELGRGGVGVVYLARERASGRPVAIKLLGGRHAGDEESMRRFAREARTVATLDHPNIVRTLAIEEVGGAAFAIVSEYVPSQTLRAALRSSGPLSFERTAQVLRDVASALVYAHARRIVHRDVKPENIFLDTTEGRALLADFGIARTLDGDTHLTAAGVAVGTPSYMAPEQIRGAEVDQRADVYALGLVGWELLTGQRPWDGETLYQVLHKQQHEHLPTLAELRPGVPDYLRTAIEGALPKVPARRWRDAEEFLRRLTPATPEAPEVPARAVAALVPVASVEPMPGRVAGDALTIRVPLAPPAVPTEAAAPGQRRRWAARATAVASGVAVALLLLAGLAIARRPRPIAPLDPALNAMLAAAARAATDSAALVGVPSTGASAVGPAAVAPAKPPTPAATPVRQPPHSVPGRTRVVAAGRLDEPAPPRNHVVAAPACATDARAAQRSCLMAAIGRHDQTLNRVYGSLIGALRRRAGGAMEPAAVQTLRVEQRAWVDARDRTCRGEGRAARSDGGAGWAAALAPCFAAQTDRRTSELQARLRVLQRAPQRDAPR